MVAANHMNHDVAEVNGSDPPMLSGSFLYEKEPGYEAKRKVHVDHLIHQAPGCVPVSSEPVPVVTGAEPLNVSEPSDGDTVTPLDQPVTSQECGTVGPHEQSVCCRSSRTVRAQEGLTEETVLS